MVTLHSVRFVLQYRHSGLNLKQAVRLIVGKDVNKDLRWICASNRDGEYFVMVEYVSRIGVSSPIDRFGIDVPVHSCMTCTKRLYKQVLIGNLNLEEYYVHGISVDEFIDIVKCTRMWRPDIQALSSDDLSSKRCASVRHTYRVGLVILIKRTFNVGKRMDIVSLVNEIKGLM